MECNEIRRKNIHSVVIKAGGYLFVLSEFTVNWF